VDTKLEVVNVLSKNVYGTHLRFDLNENITRMDYYDFEKNANMRVIELLPLEASFNINRDTRECTWVPYSTGVCFCIFSQFFSFFFAPNFKKKR